MKPEDLLLYLHKNYAEPLKFSQHLHGLHASRSTISTLICHLHIPLQSDPFLLGWASKFFIQFLSSMQITCPIHLTHYNLIL